jgi:alpha-pyrone synthase
MKSFITAIGTANPVHCFEQMKIVEFMAEGAGMNVEERKKLSVLYKASGIKKRYSVLPDFGTSKENYTFFKKKDGISLPGIKPRMELYQNEALKIALEAIRDCFLQHSSVNPLQITHLITVSCTGMYAPGLDIEIISSLNLSENIRRTCVNFMGCYAAFNALKIADSICRADENAKVLIVCVELCTIHYQNKKDRDTLLSNALFSDGAAAVIIESKSEQKSALQIDSFHCDLNTGGSKEMAWYITDNGFEMTLSSYVPELIRNGIGKLTGNLLGKFGLNAADIDCFAIHPGGKRILEVIEQELMIPRNKNSYSHKILSEYGNMSSATILFVLRDVLNNFRNTMQHGKVLSFAFGPGLTLESMLLEAHFPTRINQTYTNISSANVPAQIL